MGLRGYRAQCAAWQVGPRLLLQGVHYSVYSLHHAISAYEAACVRLLCFFNE